MVAMGKILIVKKPNGWFEGHHQLEKYIKDTRNITRLGYPSAALT